MVCVRGMFTITLVCLMEFVIFEDVGVETLQEMTNINIWCCFFILFRQDFIFIKVVQTINVSASSLDTYQLTCTLGLYM